jgi:hypothetical protein
MTATPAVTHITTDRPDVAVEVLPEGEPLMPGGYHDKRVRVFLDNRGIARRMQLDLHACMHVDEPASSTSSS